MSQIEVPRLSSFTVVGAPADNVCVSRLSVYFVMHPGDDGSEETPSRQAHVYAQKITR